MSKAKNDVNTQINNLMNRVSGQESTARFLYRIQISQLAKAESLRKAAKALVRSRRQLQFAGTSKNVVVSSNSLDALEVLLKQLPSFHAPKGKAPAFLKNIK